MIEIFPKIYKDELLYSIIARYHSISGNINLKDTIKCFFDVNSVIPVIDFPCNLDKVTEKLYDDLKIDSDYIIKHCTLFPVYSPFISTKRKNEILKMMKKKSGGSLKTKLGIIAGSVCKKEQLYYCPQCAKEDISEFGEAYFHRLHQVQGVLVCEKHNCLLKPYKYNGYVSRLQYISISQSELDFSQDFIENKGLLKHLIKIATEIKFLLDNNLDNINQHVVYQRYKMLLKDKGLLSVNGNIRQDELYKKFINYYGQDLLKMLDSTIEFKNEFNWLKVITRKPRRASHPIRHVLLIDFLCGGLQEFVKLPLKFKNNNDIKVFPCLNPVCKYYKKFVIKNIKVTPDYKTREPVGTYTCECGFTYSRKVKGDIYKIGRIKSFGPVWENKLIELVNNHNSIRSIARILNCDSKTVIKYADKFGLKDKLNTRAGIKYVLRIQEKHRRINGNKYKADIIKAIKHNPQKSIKDIKKDYYKQYMWLYRNDKEWLEQNISKLKNLSNSKYIKNNSKLWRMRDNEILSRLVNEYKILINSKRQIRITKSLLGRRIKMLAQIEKHLDKLPQTKAFLNKVCESVDEFQVRRVDKICFDLYEKHELLVAWKIKRLAGLKSNVSSTVEKKIYENINKYS